MFKFCHLTPNYFLLFRRGTSGIDIDLRRVDIDQCPQMKNSGAQQPLNIFAGTDKCKQRTTEVFTERSIFFFCLLTLFECLRSARPYPDLASDEAPINA